MQDASQRDRIRRLKNRCNFLVGIYNIRSHSQHSPLSKKEKIQPDN